MMRKLYEIYLILCFKILVVFKMVKTVTPVSANTAAAIVARFILVKIKMIILVPIENIKFEDGEVSDAQWVTIEQFLQMKENKEMISTIDFGREEYNLALENMYN